MLRPVPTRRQRGRALGGNDAKVELLLQRFEQCVYLRRETP